MRNDKMRIVVMGSGGAGGVPYAGNVWGVCDPSEPKNHRTRASVYIEQNDTRLVIDTGPDFRTQINQVGLNGALLDGVLYSHAHYDHTHGIDDLRPFWWAGGKVPVPVYASEQTGAILMKKFDHAFVQLSPLFPPIAALHVLEPVQQIKGIEVISFDMLHADVVSTGYRVGNFAYCTDVLTLPEESLQKLEGIETWVVDCFVDAREGEKSHANLDQVMAWVDRLKPKMTYLTHLNASADYNALCARLPPHIRPAYDGLEIVL